MVLGAPCWRQTQEEPGRVSRRKTATVDETAPLPDVSVLHTRPGVPHSVNDGLWLIPAPPMVFPAASRGFPGALPADLALREAAPEHYPHREPLQESLGKGSPTSSVCSQPYRGSLQFGLGWAGLGRPLSHPGCVLRAPGADCPGSSSAQAAEIPTRVSPVPTCWCPSVYMCHFFPGVLV